MEQSLMGAGLTTTGVALLLIAYRVLKAIQGKKLVSDCCGKKMEVGFQVGEMTPLPAPPPSIVIHNPMVNTTQ